ncbi:MAG TPA: hypothetical protein VKB57_21970 [Acidimicrobiales bacterium]|nr:hypothetical protein [Acidimicrobiales bacterium]
MTGLVGRPGRGGQPADVGRVLAGVHLAIHSAAVPDLPDPAEALRARILDRYLAAYLAKEPVERADLALWPTHAAGALHHQEPASADAAVVALAAGRHDAVAEAALRRVRGLA